MRSLGEASGGVVVVDADGWRADTKQAGLDRLRELGASPDVQEAIERLTSDSWLFSLRRFGRSRLRMAQVIVGSATCQRFVFFDGTDLIAAPPVAATNDETMFCFNRSGYAGEIAGMPTFTFQDDRKQTVTLSITPWREGQWQQTCKVVITFDFDRTRPLSATVE